MATVDKNFRIKNGLVVEGTTGTINGQNILTETGSDSYILSLIGGETLVKSVSSDFSVDGAGNLTINGSSDLARISDITDAIDTLGGQTSTDIADAITTANTYTDTAIGLLTTSDIEEGTNLYFTNQRALNATASAYDASGAAATAESNANDYTDTMLTGYTPTTSLDTTIDGYGYLKSADLSSYATQVYANDAASTAESNANTYTDTAIDNLNLETTYDAYGAAGTAEDNANTYTDNLIGDFTVDGTSGNTVTDRIATAVANLVDSAPAALDTLNELAAALGDNVDGMTGIATAIGNKLPLAGGTMSGNIAMGTNKVTGLGAPSSDNDAATKKYVDDQTTTDVAEGTNLYFTNQRALDATASAYDASGAAAQALTDANDYTDGYVGSVKDGSEAFTAINLNSVSMQKAAQATLSSVSTGSSMISWAKSDYGTAKAWVKFATATHSQVSEVLLTTDSSNNIAITEFAEVGTNGSLGTVTASYLAGNIAIEVDTVYANTTVTVVATLIK